MAQLCRLVPRATTNLFYVSRMSAHNLPPGTPVKVPEAKSGHHIVSGSGQFIATDGPNARTRPGIGGGSSESMLPGAQTSDDKTNPTKTSSDATDSKGPKQDTAHQGILRTPVGQFGVVAVAVVAIYAAYKMLAGHSPDQKANFKDLQARTTRPDLRGESQVHDKLAVEQNPKKPSQGKN